MNKRRFGIIGEKIAQSFLLNNDYEIIDTNFYTKRGEIDIIASQDKCIIFVEVKTRSNLKYGTPAMAVNNVKKRHMRTVAKIYLQLNKLQNSDIRFDVVEVYIINGKCKINHIKEIM
ncbi:MAG: YraN family protein [Clostridia bacterium]|nr:YraN family protein [Clostridia bacterium]